jgi:hypothetical protein
MTTIQKNQILNTAWAKIVDQDCVTLKMLDAANSAGSNYRAKAVRLRRHTNSKKLHAQLDEFIALYDSVINYTGLHLVKIAN